MRSRRSGDASAPEPTPVPLGRGLRPVLLGTATPGGHPNGQATGGPELVFGVHADDGRLLGYVVVDRVRPGNAWGKMTIAESLSLADACDIARATTWQLRLYGIRRSAHHCLVLVRPGAGTRERRAQARECTSRLSPLSGGGLCAIACTEDSGALDTTLARDAVAAAFAESTVAALDHLQLDRTAATVAVVSRSPLLDASLSTLVARGPRVVAEGDAAWTAGADVVVLDGPVSTLRASQARMVRTRVVVALGAMPMDQAVETILHERGVLLVPDTLAAGGLYVALDLRSGGIGEPVAVAQAGRMVHDRTTSLLAEAAAVGVSVPAAVRAALG